MTKQELITVVATNTEKTKKDVELIIDSTFDAICDAVQNADKVQLVGTISFTPVTKPARECRNPKTGEKMMTKEKKSVKVKMGKKFLDAIQ